MWIAAGLCAVIGIGLLATKTQKKAGTALLAAGVIVGGAGLLTALVGAVVPWLIPVAGIGLIGLGAFSLYKFFRNMKKRS
jgi:hypothetical protein